MNELKLKINEAQKRAYSLKTKKAQEKAWKLVRDLEHEAFIALCNERDAFAAHSVKGTVRSSSGGDEILVETPYGKMWVSPTADVLTKSWYPNTCCIEYREGQEIIIEIKIDVNSAGLFLEILPTRIIGGTVNEARYAELDKRTDLAFFKHSGSDGVTGLFKRAGA